MRKGGERGDDGGFLASTGGTGRDEDACVFADEGAGGPESAGGVPEGLGRERGGLIRRFGQVEMKAGMDRVGRWCDTPLPFFF